MSAFDEVVLRTMFESAAIGIALVGRDGRPIRCNPALQSMLGYTEAELVAMTFAEFTHPDDRESDLALFEDMLAGRHDSYRIEKRYVRKDGHVVHGRLTASLARAEPGNPVFAIGMVEDITDARETSDRLELALASAGLAVWDWDVVRDRVTWSAQLARLVGKAGEVSGPFGLNLAAFHPDDRDRVSKLFAEKMREPDESSFSVDFRLARPEGGYRWVTGFIRTLGDGERITRMIGVAADVTERRALEDHVRQTQKMEALGLLAGSVAHDFNNLIQVVGSCAELLQRSLKPPLLEFANDVAAAATRGAELTRQLLAFSRQSTFAPTDLELGSLVRRIEPLLRRIAGSGTEIVVALPETAPAEVHAFADRGQLEQAIFNLVVNARDAMPKGGRVTIALDSVDVDAAHVASHRSARLGPHARIRVQDTGTGIPADVLPRIFEPFFTTKPEGRGTGLGLAVVFGVVEQSRGHIVVESTPGVGTRFDVYLPMHKPR
ncbi:MAG: PAS domain S-box protein [Polyangiales bacterium]